MESKQIKIAFVVNDKGQWCAYGWSRKNGKSAEEEAMDAALEVMEGGRNETRGWITVEVPLPQEYNITDYTIETEDKKRSKR